MTTCALCGVAVLTVVLASPASGQWLDYPTAGLPRQADGRIRLNDPPPRTTDGKPDLSGFWAQPLHPALVGNIATDLRPDQVQSWAAAQYTQRMLEFGKDDPGTIGCLPLGPRHLTGSGGQATLVKIVQTTGLMLFLYEDLAYRQVYTDGRPLPRDPNPSFMGYSIGRWDGDTLVVESTGFNDRTWLDFGGHPHTEALKITERLRRVDVGRIDRQITIEDAGTFTAPITLNAPMTLRPDTDLLEYVCAENPKGREHLVGRTTSEREVSVPPDVLAKYVGIYDLERTAAFGIREFTVTLEAGQLWVALNGRGKLPMVPLTERLFSPRLLGIYEFIVDDQGRATELISHTAEEVLRAVRRR